VRAVGTTAGRARATGGPSQRTTPATPLTGILSKRFESMYRTHFEQHPTRSSQKGDQRRHRARARYQQLIICVYAGVRTRKPGHAVLKGTMYYYIQAERGEGKHTY
jgi:hypothetical protein